MDVLAIQQTLKAAGFDPGPLDGIRGRLTINAVKAFQRANGLEVDGIVGPQTERALRQIPPPPAVQTSGTVWLDEARRLMGITEGAGAANNPVILDWARDLDIAYPGDDVPWCGLFVAHCIAYTLPEEALPNSPLGARKWLTFGTAAQPGVGAIMVFWRGSRNGWEGHVAFYVSEDHDSYHVLGGNQSNKVSIARIAKNRLLDARWPKTSGGGRGGAVSGSVGGGLSNDES